MLLRDLLDDIRPSVPKAPDYALTAALQKACVEFFRESGAWRELLDPVPMEAGTNSYDLSLPTGAILARIDGAKLDKNDMAPLTTAEFFRLDQTVTGTPTHYVVLDASNEVMVWPTPSASTGQFYASAVMGAQRNITQMPDAMGEKWRDGLVSGAIARATGTPNKEWSNPATKAEHSPVFWDYVARAKRESLSGRYARPMTVPMRPLV